MKINVEKSSLRGEVEIPSSKSHTIRAVSIGLLADGNSEIINPLESFDTTSCMNAARALGASIEWSENLLIEGTGGKLKVPEDIIDVGNSGTTMNVMVGVASLLDGWTVFTGDEQTRNRSMQPLINSLNDLGAKVISTRENGFPPVIVRGVLKGGKTTIECKSSQYLTSLLISCPLAEKDTEINVPLLNEKPYVEMTMKWLDKQRIKYEHKDMKNFYIKGGQKYKAFRERIPGDFSSATFFLCAAAILDTDITLLGLDMNDSQGDKAIVNMLKEMGANVEITGNKIRIKRGNLIGREFDLNATPDTLPALSVVGCFAKGTTKLINVPQARLKETDRIKVMCEELTKMGANIKELPDGLIINESKLKSANLDGHYDHRIVMALTIAGMGVDGTTTVETAESVSITFPNFVALMQNLGAQINTDEGY